jgi:glycosyltransferase involved in cell wall biosynthesis
MARTGETTVAPPLVSILIPCYNAAPWLAATLDSALAQTHPKIEIIVIDDGSRDESLAIARRYEPHGVRVATQPNLGASAARNHGLRLASGEFIQFLDADDLLAPDKIARQVERLRAAPPGALASAEWARFYATPAESAFESQPTWCDMSGIDYMILQYDSAQMMPPIVWLTPRALIDAVGPWREDISLNDDGEFFCRVALACSQIVFCQGAKCYYRSGLRGSLSRHATPAALRSLHRSIEATTSAMLARHDSPRARRAAANAWQVLAYDLYPVLRSEANSAAGKAGALGGATRKLEGGKGVRLAARFFGWRAGAWLKFFRRRFR